MRGNVEINGIPVSLNNVKVTQSIFAERVSEESILYGLSQPNVGYALNDYFKFNSDKLAQVTDIDEIVNDDELYYLVCTNGIVRKMMNLYKPFKDKHTDEEILININDKARLSYDVGDVIYLTMGNRQQRFVVVAIDHYQEQGLVLLSDNSDAEANTTPHYIQQYDVDGKLEPYGQTFLDNVLRTVIYEGFSDGIKNILKPVTISNYNNGTEKGQGSITRKIFAPATGEVKSYTYNDLETRFEIFKKIPSTELGEFFDSLKDKDTANYYGHRWTRTPISETKAYSGNVYNPTTSRTKTDAMPIQYVIVI